MAPEVLMKSPNRGPAVDMYAIGCISYELMLSHLPLITTDKEEL